MWKGTDGVYEWGEGGGGISVEECECTVTLLLKLETHFKSEFQAEWWIYQNLNLIWI